MVGLSNVSFHRIVRVGNQHGTVAKRSHPRRSATDDGVIQSIVVQPFTPSARAVTTLPTVGRTVLFRLGVWDAEVSADLSGKVVRDLVVTRHG